MLTRRASRLERERSESLALDLSDSKEGILDRNTSPSLLPPTPQPDLKPDGNRTQLLLVKEEPVDNDDITLLIPLARTPESESESGPDVKPNLVGMSNRESTPELSVSATTPSPEPSPPCIVRVKEEPIYITSEAGNDSEAEADEALDTLGSLGLGRPGMGFGERMKIKRRVSEASVVTVEEAKVSIDDFLADRETYTADEENKLRLWQSLCIEFGLVRLEIDHLPSFANLSVDDASPITELPPIPTTCAEASSLLKSRAHINIVDYYAARDIPAVAGEERNYRHLLFESREAMVEYTRATKKFAPKGDVKHQWLQPLMKRMRPAKGVRAR